MQLLSSQIQGYIQNSSWIRKMFESGAELKKKYGSENVYDFSLGNPDLPPPAGVGRALHSLADKADQPFVLGYMHNAGYLETRQGLAKYLSQEQHSEVGPEHLILTCGAAGGINAFFKAVLEPEDEIICPAPYFVEYGFYVQNHGGRLKPVPCKAPDFELDLEAMDQAITVKTRAVLINSPNNPTGRVYTQEELQSLAEILTKHSKQNGRPIYLLSDEPYRFLTYDQVQVPALLPFYPYTVIISSFSKNLALAGERIGYVLINPAMPECEKLNAGLVLANRILGFVNAPAVAQHIITHCLGEKVDTEIYAHRRQCMADILSRAGINFPMPQGGFYFFAKAPNGMDDVEFVDILMKERILAVPGSGFGYPGYIRLAFCVDEQVIRGAGPGLIRVMDEIRS